MKMHETWAWAALPMLAIVLIGLAARSDELSPTTERPNAEFHFARLAYPDAPASLMSGYGRNWGSWEIDWPDAEFHFLQGISRLTRVDASHDARIVTLNDDVIFDYPWLYAVEVGHWYLDETNAARLREYLARGGFLMVDDFHGSLEWATFIDSMKRVFPDRPIVEIPEGDEVLHVLYDLNERVQIPGIGPLMRGRTYEKDGFTPHWRGIYDDAGRLIVAIDFNMDMGDAWEHADNPIYPENMTALAYRFAGNYVVYAMTH
jgi:Domain of unknown function (DUF4159)